MFENWQARVLTTQHPATWTARLGEKKQVSV